MKKVSLLLLLLLPLLALAKHHAEDPSEQRRQRKVQRVRRANDLVPVVFTSTNEWHGSSSKRSKPPTKAPTIAKFIDKNKELTILFEAIKRVSGRPVDLRIIFPDRFPEETERPSPAKAPAPTPRSPPAPAPAPTPRSPPAPAPAPAPTPRSPPPPAPTPTPPSSPVPGPNLPSILGFSQGSPYYVDLPEFPPRPPQPYFTPFTPPRQYSSTFSPPQQYSSTFTPPQQYSSTFTPPQQYSSTFTPPQQYSSTFTPPPQQYSSTFTPPPQQSSSTFTPPRQPPSSGGGTGGGQQSSSTFIPPRQPPSSGGGTGSGQQSSSTSTPPRQPPSSGGGTGDTIVGGAVGGAGSVLVGGPNRKLRFIQGNPLRRANLLQILDEPGDFTFFAPTNDAFRLIPERVLELLFLQDEFIPHLEDLLLYHGLNGKRFVADFSSIEIVKTFNDEGVLFRRQPSDSVENLRVNQNNVRRRNINASNGVTHVIDGVLAPDWVSNSILAKVANADDLSILFELIEIAELTEALDIFGQELTLVAPTNDAFNTLGNANLQALRSPENKEGLITILAYHVIFGVIISDELDEIDGGSLTTAQGGVVVVSVEAELGGITRKINQATVLSDDSILTNNGVFYKIDAVLNPNSVDGF